MGRLEGLLSIICEWLGMTSAVIIQEEGTNMRTMVLINISLLWGDIPLSKTESGESLESHTGLPC